MILATYRDLTTAVTALEAATATYAADRTEPNRTAAQDAWRTAMDAWQLAEVFQVGPAGVSGVVSGGQDLRDEIYSWPLSNRCRVDQETVAAEFGSPELLAAELINVRGLDAMEYLLFTDDAANGCPADSPINLDGSWAALDADTLALQRADHAHALSQDVQRSVAVLVAAWELSAGAFVRELADAGNGSSVYATTLEGMNALTDAMFYVETETKDRKLAVPAGISLDCAAATCPDMVESLYAHLSRENVLSNVRAFERLHLGDSPGTDAPGFDDILRAQGDGRPLGPHGDRHRRGGRRGGEHRRNPRGGADE